MSREFAACWDELTGTRIFGESRLIAPWHKPLNAVLHIGATFLTLVKPLS